MLARLESRAQKLPRSNFQIVNFFFSSQFCHMMLVQNLSNISFVFWAMVFQGKMLLRFTDLKVYFFINFDLCKKNTLKSSIFYQVLYCPGVRNGSKTEILYHLKVPNARLGMNPFSKVFFEPETWASNVKFKLLLLLSS